MSTWIDMATRYTEEYAHDILIRCPTDTDALVELISLIDEQMRQLYGAIPPQIVVAYGGYMQALNARRRHHPRFQDYLRIAQRNSDASFLRKRVRRNVYAIVRLKLFFRKVVQNFLEEFYAPDGKGYKIAEKDWHQSV